MSSSSSEDSEFNYEVPVVPGLFSPPINRTNDDVPIDSVFADAERNMAGHDNEEEYDEYMEGHGSRNDDDDRENIENDEERNNEDDEEGDDGVLDGEEEVLAVGGEGELVSVGVSESDSIGKCLQDIGDEGYSAGRARGHDCVA